MQLELGKVRWVVYEPVKAATGHISPPRNHVADVIDGSVITRCGQVFEEGRARLGRRSGYDCKHCLQLLRRDLEEQLDG